MHGARSILDGLVITITTQSFLFTLLGPYFGCQGSLLGPYFTKKLVPIGSIFQSLGVPICFRHSAYIFRTFGGASSKRYPVLHHTFPTRIHSHFSWFPGSFRWVFDIYATQICICGILLPIIHIWYLYHVVSILLPSISAPHLSDSQPFTFQPVPESLPVADHGSSAAAKAKAKVRICNFSH